MLTFSPHTLHGLVTTALPALKDGRSSAPLDTALEPSGGLARRMRSSARNKLGATPSCLNRYACFEKPVSCSLLELADAASRLARGSSPLCVVPRPREAVLSYLFDSWHLSLFDAVFVCLFS